MTHHLKSRDIIALGFMTFALFVGAGNIIFPPMVGLQAGEHVWTAAFGFLITAVGLPVLTWPWVRCLPPRVPRPFPSKWVLLR